MPFSSLPRFAHLRGFLVTLLLVGAVGPAFALNPPTFSAPRGFYSAAFNLTLAVDPADTSPGLRVRYTLDGSAPTPTTGQDFNAPIPVTTTTVVRALVYDSSDPASVSVSVAGSYLFVHDVVAQPADIPGASDPRFANYPSYPRETYDIGRGLTARHDYAMDPTIVNDPAYDVAAALLAIPTVSITSDLAHMFGPDGFYDGDAEEPASMEILYPNAPADDQQVNCSIQSHSTNRLKRALRLSFSKDFGPSKLVSDLLRTTPVNPSSIATESDTLVLRSGNNRSWARAWNPDATAYTEDEWFRDSQAAMTGVGAHGTFVQLYINGLYWGLYNITERPDESFAALYLGGKKKDHFSLKEDGREKGDSARWDYLMGTVLPKDMTVPANYAEMRGYFDVGLFSDYLILEWYTAVSDWPRNNWWVDIRTDVPTPARYLAWDGEWSWDRGDPLDPSTHGESPHGAWVHPAFRNGSTDDSNLARFWRALKVNTDFMTTFADHVYQQTAPGAALSDLESRRRWNALNLFVEDAVVAESARWGDAVTPGAPRTRDDDWNRAVNNIYGLMGGNGPRLISALRAQGYYPDIDPPQFSRDPGHVPQGATLVVANRNPTGTIYCTTDGSDPRLPGGAISSAAVAYAGPLTISAPTTVEARVRDGSTWSALAQGTFVPTTANEAPAVRAVGPITTTLNTPIFVDARATDDGLPSSTIAHGWTQVSGPGAATFDSPDALRSGVSFSATGSYVLRFTASDGERQSSSDVAIFVYPEPPAIAVESFSLINADTDTVIAGYEALPEGATIDFATLPTRRLNIRANTTPTSVGSVRFGFDGKQNVRTESVAPYSFAGDASGDYDAWTPAPGNHTLSGTPYRGASATGATGTALTVHFQVTDSSPAGDTTPPSSPTGLSADSVTATAFVLHWTAARDDVGVTGYEVFRDGVSAGTTTGTSKTIAGLAPGTTCAMTARARDAAGNWSDPSAPLAVTTTAGASLAVDSLTLINADTDTPVAGFESIPDGATIDLSSLPTKHLNLRANTSPATVGSVRFGYDGSANQRTESTAPYAFAGDDGGNFRAWTPAVGAHVVTATPYGGANAGGSAGPTLTVHLNVTDSSAPALSVTSFSLIDAETDRPVPGYETIANNTTISRAGLPTTHLNLRVNTAPATVGSVRITFDGTARIESAAPYAYFGDTNGDFKAAAIANGSHALAAKAYANAGATGANGATLTISFTIQ